MGRDSRCTGDLLWRIVEKLPYEGDIDKAKVGGEVCLLSDMKALALPGTAVDLSEYTL